MPGFSRRHRAPAAARAQLYNGAVTPSARLSPIPTEIVDAFRAVAPAVEGFSRARALLIVRYPRGEGRPGGPPPPPPGGGGGGAPPPTPAAHAPKSGPAS